MLPHKRNSVRDLDLIQFAGLMILMGFISRYSGPTPRTPLAAWVILVVGAGTLMLMWLTTLKARE
jgi:hypothetical protein